MFNNVGSKVKTLAVVVCALGILASLISGIAIWAGGIAINNNARYSYEKVSTFWPGLLTIVLGSFLSWLGSLTTCAIGEAAERAELNGAELYELKNRLSKLEAAQAGGKAPEAGTPAARPVGRPYAAPAAAAAFTADGKWRCRKCGSMNDRSSLYCKDCGEYR